MKWSQIYIILMMISALIAGIGLDVNKGWLIIPGFVGIIAFAICAGHHASERT